MKYIPYGHQNINTHDIDAVVEILHHPWLTQGPKVAAFEEALAKATGAKYAVLVQMAPPRSIWRISLRGSVRAMK
jgi:dTDP-4-amino-4,6-dideoxygalactose transaminase